MESTHQDSLGTPRESLPRPASEVPRAAPQPLHTAPEAAQLGTMTQLAQHIVQQARETATTLEKNAQEALAQAKADARELVRKAEQQASELVREARSYAETLLTDAKKHAQQEKDLADSWAVQIRTAAKADGDAQRRQSQEEQAIEKRELDRLQRLVSELRAEATTAYELAMKARATIDAAARAEFELRTKELTNLHTVVQTTTDLAKQVIKPSEPKTSTTEVIGGVVTQFIQSAQSVFEKAIDRSPGVQELVGEVALRGRQAIASTPTEGTAAPSPTDPGAAAPAPSGGTTAAQSAQDDVDLELLRLAQDLRADQIPEAVLQRLCQARYGHTDLSKLTFRDLNAAAFLFLEEQRRGAAS